MAQRYHHIETDVLVIGAGGAGCRAAMAASDRGATVTLLDKGRLGVTGSTFDPFTRGKGLTVAIAGYNPTDDPEVHYRQAMDAACGLANPALIAAVASEVPERFRELLDTGFPFRPNRLGACFGGGMIGAVIEQTDLAHAFRREIQRRPIRILERTMAIHLLTDGGHCCGAVAVQAGGALLVITARATILATGGASSVFRYHLTSPALTGDGYVMALAAGAALTNIEFYQAILGTTHPVRTFFPQWFLAGKPALSNRLGHRFLTDYLPGGASADELVYERSFHGPFTTSRPTGWVDIAIYGEIMAGRGTSAPMPGVCCDFAGLPASLRRELDEAVGRPALAWLAARNMDLEAGPVPIAPFAHAFNGGIVIDEYGQTAVPGLYACGEVAAGPHGANRVGGHMFAVLLVFGKRAGEHAADTAAGRIGLRLPEHAVANAATRIEILRRSQELPPVTVRRAIQQAMERIMIVKDAGSLVTAVQELARIGEETLPRVGASVPALLFEALSVANMHQVATLVARAALLRDETRGPHYRTDFPAQAAGGRGEMNLIWRASELEPVSSWGRLTQEGSAAS